MVKKTFPGHEMQREMAETVALGALGWLVGSEELLDVFLGATGASGADMSRRAGDADFLASVLDFLLMNDVWITAFCAESGYEPTAPMRARAMLPGGDLPNWT